VVRTVVVTGGGTGIGKAIAEAFVAEGAKVVITGRREQTLRAAAEAIGARYVVCDGTDVDAVSSLGERLGDPVNVLVNNAGGNKDFEYPPGEDLRALADSWRANLEANLLSAVLTTAALDKQLVPGGAVIHIGSFATDRGAGSYGAAKAALASWSIALAMRLGKRDITSNVVSPGYIDDTEFFRDRMTPEFHAARTAETLTGRPGHPADIAGAVLFLASPGARQVTGQVLHVNGGALTTR